MMLLLHMTDWTLVFENGSVLNPMFINYSFDNPGLSIIRRGRAAHGSNTGSNNKYMGLQAHKLPTVHTETVHRVTHRDIHSLAPTCHPFPP